MEIVVIIAILLFSIIFHEYAHGWTANKFGDPTAKLAGRLTLNPIKHIDPIGTVVLPGILLFLRFLGYDTFIFGWAKPVPVNFLRLRNPKKNMIWVALAGPAINIIIALVFSRCLTLNISDGMKQVFALAVFINLLLAIFNLIPIPPLDGSRVVMGLLPARLAKSYMQIERYGILILFVLLYLGIFEWVVYPLIQISGRVLGVQL